MLVKGKLTPLKNWNEVETCHKLLWRRSGAAQIRDHLEVFKIRLDNKVYKSRNSTEAVHLIFLFFQYQVILTTRAIVSSTITPSWRQGSGLIIQATVATFQK